MLEHYFKYSRVIARFRRDALGNEIDRIAAELQKAGYRQDSAKIYLGRIARFSLYATECGCSKVTPIPAQVVARYLQSKPTIASRLGAHGAISFATRCCPERFEPQSPKDEPDSTLLAAYLRHLYDVRGLQPKTCEGLILTARRMLLWQRRNLPETALSALVAKHVLEMTHGLLSVCRSNGAKSSTTAYMRSFLRYLHWANLNSHDLSQFVPKTSCWRLAHLPPRLVWSDVQRAIENIETSTTVGKRDRAIMILLSTTGMRARELRDLEFRDIRWRTGELILRNTKGHRDRVVPLLNEAGAALAEYVLHARPQLADRRVFLLHVTPVRPIQYSGIISRIVRVRLQRAGVPIQCGGAHLLRHSLATRLVEQHRPIKEVADLLGHRNIDTTSLYVKVAVPQLADVALPFPGGES